MANGKSLPKHNPTRRKRDATIAQLYLQGYSYKEIANKVELNKSTVWRVLQDDEIKDSINAGSKQMVSFAGIALGNIFNTLTDDDNKELRYKASTDVLKTIGIMPSHTTSTLIQNIYQDNRQVTTESVALLADLMDYRHRIKPQLETQEVIDVESHPKEDQS